MPDARTVDPGAARDDARATSDRSAESAAAQHIARVVMDGFSHYRREFDALTRGARSRFERAAWAEAQQATLDRIECYALAVTRVADSLRSAGTPDLGAWRQARADFIPLAEQRVDGELAETFFNSLYCRLWDHGDIRDANLFVHSDCTLPDAAAEPPATRRHALGANGSWREPVAAILREHGFRTPWQDLERDIEFAELAIEEALAAARPAALVTAAQAAAGRRVGEPIATELGIELVSAEFYRNKGAYLVGHIYGAGERLPLAIAVLHDENGAVYIDNVMIDEDELSIVFSFTRSYFMVDVASPRWLVEYLNFLLPGKKRFELYNAIGFYRHGKTEFYRDLLAHLDASDDPFITAPGIRGMVMAVFTLPSYQAVFKIIKDRFPPQKDITRAQVMAAYTLVKMHDRVGRMADTQEFANLRLPRHRFDDELLEELLRVAAGSVTIDGDEVLIRHCYTERLMTPLNMYLDQADDTAIREALDEYGNAIRQLAAANIFPGDMLLKNFGVTRHGRVVFYDYDEICYLTDVNFRHIPEPQTPEQEMSAEPWYSVGPNDVFPEEFPRFMFANRRIKRLFTELHGEIFDADYWQGLQRNITEGQIMDVFPYRRRRRFVSRFGSHREDDTSAPGTGMTGHEGAGST